MMNVMNRSLIDRSTIIKKLSFLWAAAAVFLLLALVLMVPHRELDRQVFLTINMAWYQALSHTGQLVWNSGFPLLTQFGDLHIMLWLVLLVNLPWWLLGGRKHPFLWRQRFLVLTITVLIASLLSSGLKSLFSALRPASVLAVEQLHILGPILYHRSFPSGHTMTVFAGITLLLPMMVSRTGRMLLVGLALVVGLSRITLGAHWPIDVVGGAFLGIVAGSLGWWMTLRLMHQRQTSAAQNVGQEMTLSKGSFWLCRIGIIVLLVNVLITPFSPLPYQSVRLWALGSTLVVIFGWFYGYLCYQRSMNKAYDTSVLSCVASDRMNAKKDDE